MTGEKYKDADVPFCVRCSRFMVIRVGRIWVALNHEKDQEFLVRSGIAYRCPKCACIAIYKWFEPYRIPAEDFWKFTHNHERWTIFLEDHIHYYENRPEK